MGKVGCGDDPGDGKRWVGWTLLGRDRVVVCRLGRMGVDRGLGTWVGVGRISEGSGTILVSINGWMVLVEVIHEFPFGWIGSI